jgi:glyoxylase-like metal-dependent hydrolase (beta-lactamase superfamily II)
MHLPGHSSGYVALYNSRNQYFFSGDVVYDGELLDELEDSVAPWHGEAVAIENRRSKAGSLS